MIVAVLEEDGTTAERTTLSDGAHPEEPAEITDVLLFINLLVMDNLRIRKE